MAEEQKTFSEEYVKQLREENASWRTKYREVETRATLEKELMTQGLKADPKWVQVNEGETVQEAVARFANEYPHLKTQENVTTTPNVPSPQVKPIARTNVPGPSARVGSDRTLAEVKKDPQARKVLREQYRQLLAQSSHKHLEE